MPAPKGNRFWEARASHGRPALYDDPKKLWKDCVEYFQWVMDNPLIAYETVKYEGKGTLMEVPRLRAMTIMGLCSFLQISQKTWGNYRDKEDFVPVITRAEEVIKQQKFEGAAAELLNANIIARDLGLADKKQLDLGNLGDRLARAKERLSDDSNG